MIDLKQVKAICETSTERSLILIDEFGKGKLLLLLVITNIFIIIQHFHLFFTVGTNQNDGMALFSGLLSYFANKNVRLLAITHMYEVFRGQLINGNPETHFKFCNMKVLSDISGLCYLFRLAEGLGEEQSFAIECARESGISEEILNRGKASCKWKMKLIFHFSQGYFDGIKGRC